MENGIQKRSVNRRVKKAIHEGKMNKRSVQNRVNIIRVEKEGKKSSVHSIV